MITLVFLGKLAELAGTPTREVSAPLDWPGLLGALGTALAAQAASDRVRLALNGALLADKTQLQAAAGDEVALLPPVSGG
ncbi:MoaD/ThiS family protein [Croceibacterium sp. TMG7-5b_MA50]|uniref:MoaD/ThiS family protein n=1 Tax=Croceibacterium sp. TMG7-5b_MA50 TaxID=3121290 RepID=UPI0032220045